MYRQTAKISPTFEQSDGGTIHTFHLHNMPRETEWQCIFNKRTLYRAVGVSQLFLMAKCTGGQQKSPQVLSKAMEDQSTRFICITYWGKQNGRVLLTNKQCTEQLKLTQILLWQNAQAPSKNRFKFRTEEQTTHFICISHQGKWNGSVLLMYGAVGGNTNSPHRKCVAHRANFKIVLTFKCGDWETIYIFHSYNYPEKQNGILLLMYEALNKQLKQKQILDQTATVP